MNKFSLWFHQLFNPHCPHCEEMEMVARDEINEDKVCDTCEVLKVELTQAHIQINELQRAFLNPPKVDEPKIDTSSLKPVLPTRVPWKVRQQMLEKEDRHAAELIRERMKDKPSITQIEELEKEMGIADSNKEEEDAVPESNAQV